jgi:hypothetical protein
MSSLVGISCILVIEYAIFLHPIACVRRQKAYLVHQLSHQCYPHHQHCDQNCDTCVAFRHNWCDTSLNILHYAKKLYGGALGGFPGGAPGGFPGGAPGGFPGAGEEGPTIEEVD